MDDDDFVLDPDLVELVLAEAQENLESAIAMLGSENRGKESVDALFRCFHSIKGNCAMAHRKDLAETAHRMETELDKVRSDGRALSTDEAGLFLELSDLLVLLLTEDDKSVLVPIDRCLRTLEKKIARANRGPDSAPQSEELLVDARTGKALPDAGTRLKVDVSMLVATMKVAGELFQLDERLKHFATQSVTAAHDARDESELRDGLNQISREFDSAIERLYDLLLDIQRLPVSQIASPLERAVRDIRRKTGKEVEFKVLGRDLRVDKQVLQVLRDPLMHMVRNSADHGIEMPDLRERSGKARTGTITLQVEDLDDVVAVTVLDDGAGIDLERVKQKAVERGLVEDAAAEKLSPQEVVEFIFKPGFSTASKVSDLSGRGVGMDVVLQQIRGSGGAVTTETEPGKGTHFRMEIPKAGSPVTDGLAVRTGNTVHLIPLKNVVTFVGRREMRVWRQPDDQVLARVGQEVFSLLRVPGEPDAKCLSSPRTIGVVLSDRQCQRFLVPVDEVLGRRKALVQGVTSLSGTSLSGTEFERSEVCILGDGTMAFSLQIDQISKDPTLVWRSIDDRSLGHEFETESVAAAS